MQVSSKFSRVVGGRRYTVGTSTLLAHDQYWDGHNHERQGRNTWLYRTANGRFFTVTLTQWQGERDALEPVTIDDARELYEGPLSEHEVSYEAAFPNIDVEDA
jgi:hypothetical protein